MNYKYVRVVIVSLVFNLFGLAYCLAASQETSSTGSRNDIVGYVAFKVNQIVGTEGTPTLQARVEKYPVVFADLGARCEFFLKNPKQDITKGSGLSERVYFKDVARIVSLKGVSVQSDQYTVHVYVGNKRYEIRKWSGIASIAANVRGGTCNNIDESNLIYTWPTFQFKVLTGRNTVQWMDVGLTSIVEFGYNKSKGIKLYNEISRKAKPEVPGIAKSKKSFEQLKEEARKKAEQQAEARKEKGLQISSERQLEESAVIFRAKVAEGDGSHCGLVIEVKDKVVKVQTAVGEYWLKRQQLYPADAKPCNFLNGVYQEP